MRPSFPRQLVSRFTSLTLSVKINNDINIFTIYNHKTGDILTLDGKNVSIGVPDDR